MANKIIVADSGPLIALGIVGLLPQLKHLLGEIIVPETVYQECIVERDRSGAKSIYNAVQATYLTLQQTPASIILSELCDILDRGEIEAISLAKSMSAIILIDEKKGRTVAQHYHLDVIGSMAVIITAKQSGIIKTVAPLISQLEVHGYRLSNQLKKNVLKRVNEQ